jgi:hypothetical protein
MSLQFEVVMMTCLLVLCCLSGDDVFSIELNVCRE